MARGGADGGGSGRGQGPWPLSAGRSGPGGPRWPADPASRAPRATGAARAPARRRRRPGGGGAAGTRPAGVEGGAPGVAEAAWKTAHTAYQSVDAPREAVPCWAPAALDVMSSANAEPFEFCARGVYGTPALLPGVAEWGSPPVTRAANTSSPASTGAVAPVSTVVPMSRAGTIWSSAPARATPQ